MSTAPEVRLPGRPPKGGGLPNVRTTVVECGECHHKCRTGAMLQRHLNKSHPDRLEEFACRLCGYSHASRDNVLHHLLQHWSVGKSCPLVRDCDCPYKFNRRAPLFRHLADKHELTRDEKCIATTAAESRKDKENSTVCQLCRKTFSTSFTLKRHMRSHTGERPYACSVCEAKFVQKISYVRHMLTHSDAFPFECPRCPAAFRQLVNLNSHIRQVHPAQPAPCSYNCSYCSCVFRRKHTLDQHVEKFHKETTEDQDLTDTINDVMKNLVPLSRAQINTCDNVENPIRVDPLLFDEFPNVQTDLSSDSHTFNNKVNKTPEKSHPCDVCQKAFRTKYDLSVHVTIHLNVKPFKCEICNKSFRLQGYLNKHQQGVHKMRDGIRIEKLLTTENNMISNEKTDLLGEIVENLNNNNQMVEYDFLEKSTERTDATFEDVNVINNSDGFEIQLLPNDLIDQNNIDAEISMLCDNSILNGSADDENLDLKHNFNIDNICLETSFNTDQIKEEFRTIQDTSEQNDLLEFDMGLNETCLLDDVPISLSDINFVDNIFNISPKKTIPNDDLPIPTISISNSSDAVDEFFPSIPNSLAENLDEQITDVDILKFIKETVVPKDCNVNKVTNESHQKSATLKSNLQTIKKHFGVTNKNSHKNIKFPKCCEFCPASFQKHSALLRHRRVHTQEKPFICKVCQASFAGKSSLVTHERTHLPEKQRKKFMCQVCGVEFLSSSALSLHKRKHMEELPHSCLFCSAKFRTSGHLDTHLLCHLKKDDFKTNVF